MVCLDVVKSTSARDTNYKSIHNFIISTDVNCSKFVEQKNKRLNIYKNKVILYNINK